MTPFEYACPETEAEAVQLLAECHGEAAVLAGGTDLVSLLKSEVVTPKRVVDVKRIGTMHGIRSVDGGLLIGALTTLEELQDDPRTEAYASLHHVAEAIRAIQIQQSGTIGGDLCHLPNCWYFRNGYGLLAMHDGSSLVEEGENRYHAVFGNRGPAKFVSASRFAPPAIAWEAAVRIVGPKPDDEQLLPLEAFYVTPPTNRHGVTVLRPGQFVTHLWLPNPEGRRSASYEVLELNGLDWPLAAAAATLRLRDEVVQQARIVMGHVAPVPWVARKAADAIIGRVLDEETAEMAADIAVADATPLSQNEYKVQIARAAVKRALLRAVDRLEGGL